LTNDSYDFTGRYEGVIDGIKTSICIKQQGSSIQGELIKGRSYYNIIGIVTGNNIQGRISDIQSIESYMLQAEINNGLLVINLIAPDLKSGSAETKIYKYRH